MAPVDSFLGQGRFLAWDPKRLGDSEVLYGLLVVCTVLDGFCLGPSSSDVAGG